MIHPPGKAQIALKQQHGHVWKFLLDGGNRCGGTLVVHDDRCEALKVLLCQRSQTLADPLSAVVVDDDYGYQGMDRCDPSGVHWNSRAIQRSGDVNFHELDET